MTLLKTQKKVFGAMPLETIVSPTASHSKDELTRISETIEMLGGPEGNGAFECEKMQLKQLCLRRAQLEYPKIDLTFLGMQSYGNITDRGMAYRIPLPRFAVYKLNGTHNAFEVYFNTIAHQDLVWVEFKTVEKDSPPNVGFQSQENIHLPLVIGKELIRSIRPKSRISFPRYYCPLREEDVEKFQNVAFHIRHSFNGIIPQESRERIERAKKTFRGEDMYIVAEVKPEDWNVQHNIASDPLIVGVAGENVYLIDCFDTTCLEDYVRSEFSS